VTTNVNHVGRGETDRFGFCNNTAFPSDTAVVSQLSPLPVGTRSSWVPDSGNWISVEPTLVVVPLIDHNVAAFELGATIVRPPTTTTGGDSSVGTAPKPFMPRMRPVLT
jgi:hypothetical protein